MGHFNVAGWPKNEEFVAATPSDAGDTVLVAGVIGKKFEVDALYASRIGDDLTITVKTATSPEGVSVGVSSPALLEASVVDSGGLFTGGATGEDLLVNLDAAHAVNVFVGYKLV